MLHLIKFQPEHFDLFISWIDSPGLLTTIAGPKMSYPLTHEQLYRYLADEKSDSFTVVNTEQNLPVGHAEIIHSGNDMVKLDKVLIGEPSDRGKGLGLHLIHLLVDHAFSNFPVSIVELNVYDWNTAGIKCYLKAGFEFNPEKNFPDTTGDITWLALNMIITREKWLGQKK